MVVNASTNSSTAPTDANYSYTFVSGDLPVAGASKSFGGVSWTYSGDSHSSDTYVGFEQNRGVQIGKGTSGFGAISDMTISTQVSNFGNSVRITKMAIGMSCASSGGYSGSFSNNDVWSGSSTSVIYYSSTAMNVESGDIVFTFKSTKNNKAIYVKAIYVWYQVISTSKCSLIELDKPQNFVADEVEIGQKVQFGYSALDDEANEWVGSVVYSSSNTNVATIDENGLLTAVGEGNTTISVVDEDGNADADSTTITVLADPERINLPSDNYNFTITSGSKEKGTQLTNENIELKAKEGRTWYKNISVSYTDVAVNSTYQNEIELAKTTGEIQITNNSNAIIEKVTVHYYKYLNDGVGIYVNDSPVAPNELLSTGTSGVDNDLCRVYDNIQGNSFSLKNTNASHTTNIYSLRVDLFVAGLYTVTFKDGDSTLSSQEVYENKTVSRPDDPTKQDYFFVGWKKGNDIYDFSSPVTESFDLIAHWTQDPAVVIQNDINQIDSHLRLGFSYDKTPAVWNPGYVLYNGEITEGDYIIYYNGKAMNSTVTSNRLQYEEVTPVDGIISTSDTTIVWHISKSGDYWNIYNESSNSYAASTGAKNKAQLLADGTDNKSLWEVTGTETYEFINKANTTASVNANLRNNGNYGFACYADSTGGALSLYKYTPHAYVDSYTYDNSSFKLLVGVDKTIANINDIDSYGIKVNNVYYEYTNEKFHEDGDILYTVIDLGDILETPAHADVTFTVCGYVEADSVKYDSTSTKSYSVKTLLKHYIDNYSTLGISNEELAILQEVYRDALGGTLQ